MIWYMRAAQPCPAVAVFSGDLLSNKGLENVYLDGVEAPYFRADYVLRAVQIASPAHIRIEFKFHPASYYTGEKVSLAGSVILVLALIGAVFAETRRKKQVVEPQAAPAETRGKSRCPLRAGKT